MPGFSRQNFCAIAARGGLVGGGGGQAEFVAQFLLPLVHQRRHGEHQEPLHHAAREQFLDDQARLDGFAQAHFVGQQGAAAQRAEHAQRGADLVFQPFDAAMRQAKQIVRLVGNPPKRGAFAQEKSAQIRQRKCRLLKRQRRHLKTHRNRRQRRAALGGQPSVRMANWVWRARISDRRPGAIRAGVCARPNAPEFPARAIQVRAVSVLPAAVPRGNVQSPAAGAVRCRGSPTGKIATAARRP